MDPSFLRNSTLILLWCPSWCGVTFWFFNQLRVEHYFQLYSYYLSRANCYVSQDGATKDYISKIFRNFRSSTVLPNGLQSLKFVWWCGWLLNLCFYYRRVFSLQLQCLAAWRIPREQHILRRRWLKAQIELQLHRLAALYKISQS